MLAVVAISISAIPILIKLIIGTIVFFSFRHNFNDAQTQPHLIWRAGNHWIIDNNPLQPQLGQRAHLTSIDFLSRWLVIITLNADHKRTQRYVIVFDALSADCYRLLRVRLKIEGHGLVNPDDNAQ